jgi:transposase
MGNINYVGIDMAKASFFACLAEGQEAKKWNNNKPGINSFFRYLKQNHYNKNNTVLGVESTGSYHLPICIASKSAGYAIKVINPLIVKKQNFTTLRRVKNDKKDALLIRYCLIQGNGYKYEVSEEDFILKALVRQRNAISYNKLRIQRQKDDLDYKGNIINTKINNIYHE